MTDQPSSRWVGIDWGSTHRRAYLLDAEGCLLDRHADAEGVLRANGDFAGSLRALLARWPELGPSPTVCMAGMIGSRSGWVEAPYLPTPVSLTSLRTSLVNVPFDGAQVYIVPGVCDDEGPDVMRGEEAQVLGAWRLGGGDGCYLLPGTHSKWVWVEGGRILRLHTFMTGELFEQLRRQGTLAGVLGDAAIDSAAFSTAFEAGLEAAEQPRALTRALFGLRASVLRDRLSPAAALPWLSGLLIGSEWADPLIKALAVRSPVRLVGDPRLAELHARAAARLGVPVQVYDPDDVFVAALGALNPHLSTPSPEPV